jgi:adenylate cyclase
LALAAALDHPFTTAYARYHAGLLRLWRREPDAAHFLATELLDLAGEHEFRIWTAAGTVLRGAARVGLGRVDEGLADVRNGIGLYGELRSPPIFWPFLLFVQARACADGGRPAEGLSAVDRSMDVLGEGSGASLEPELWIAKGDLVRALTADGSDDGAEAEPWYRRALDRATDLGALTAQLRAATRLARLRLDGGDPAAASALLGPILGSLTEGFDTADVREARELLEGVATP